MVNASASLSVGLAAFASCRVRVEELASLRRHPGPMPKGGESQRTIPANLLRQSDEQTVVSLVAILNAIDRFRLGDHFSAWAVVAAPRFIGRTSVAQALPRFLAEGPWGVSPHIIPHRTLHSVPGTISQALALHGPNFGVGGGSGCEVDALLAGFALLHSEKLSGVWIVCSRLLPDGPIDRSGQPPPGTEVLALALALTPTATDTTLELTLGDEVNGEPFALDHLDSIDAQFTAGSGSFSLGIGQLVLLRRRASSSFLPHPSSLIPSFEARELR